MKTNDLEREAMHLPLRKRAALAARLLESLDGDDIRPHAVEWSEEAEARLTAYDAGELSAKPADQVLAYAGKHTRTK